MYVYIYLYIYNHLYKALFIEYIKLSLFSVKLRKLAFCTQIRSLSRPANDSHLNDESASFAQACIFHSREYSLDEAKRRTVARFSGEYLINTEGNESIFTIS